MDDRGHRDDPDSLAGFGVCGVQPDIEPVAGERAVEEGGPPFGDILAQLGHRALGDAAHSHGRCQRIDMARGHAADPGFLHDGHRGRLGGFAGLRKAGDIVALARLR